MTTLRVAVLCVAAGGALSGQSYYGSITSAGCSGIYGWAWNSASPQTSVDVALYNGTAYLGSWPASAYSAPNGNNYSGFTIPIPSTLQDNQQYHPVHHHHPVRAYLLRLPVLLHRLVL